MKKSPPARRRRNCYACAKPSSITGADDTPYCIDHWKKRVEELRQVVKERQTVLGGDKPLDD